MNKVLPHRLGRRERQIMDILYQRGASSVTDVMEAMPDAPSYSAVRTFLRILEEKGQIKHTEVGSKYIYTPTESWTTVAKSAIDNVVQTFFGGSVERAVATLLANQHARPTEAELGRLEELIHQTRAEERLQDDTVGGTGE
ncbi:MAG: BlaI/MecI/CopY family transcriptional regulator [Capsulimonas sp.]|uniref:BlaI/MecI/CopY family transcriptional regulator n=1 Tax=Capsulimonas sp. TaxID=2494211 RepID=UPI0032636307